MECLVNSHPAYGRKGRRERFTEDYGCRLYTGPRDYSCTKGSLYGPKDLRKDLRKRLEGGSGGSVPSKKEGT